MQETWVPSLGQEDPLRRAWQPTPVFLPGESHGWEGAWWATIHGVAKSQAQLSNFTPIYCAFLHKLFFFFWPCWVFVEELGLLELW